MYVCNCGGYITMFGGPGSYIAHCRKCQSKGIGSTMDLAVKAMVMPEKPAVLCKCGGEVKVISRPGFFVKCVAECTKCNSLGIGKTAAAAVSSMVPSRSTKHAVPGEMVDPTTLTDYFSVSFRDVPVPIPPQVWTGIRKEPLQGYLSRKEYDRLAKAFGFAADVEPATLIRKVAFMRSELAKIDKDYEDQHKLWAGMVDRANQRASQAADENGTLRAKLKDMESRAAMLALELDTLKRKVVRS